MNLLFALASVEIKSIIRHKFLIQTLLINLAIYISLFLFMVNNLHVDSLLELIFFNVMLVGFPYMVLSPFFFSKDMLIFQALISRPIAYKKYLYAKILPTIIFSITYNSIIFSWALKRGYITPPIFLSSLLYFSTFGLFLMTYCASFDENKINLNRTPIFSYQGFSFFKTLVVFPIPLPLILYSPTRNIGIALMASFGILSFLFIKKITQFIAKNITKRKYILSNL